MNNISRMFALAKLSSITKMPDLDNQQNVSGNPSLEGMLLSIAKHGKPFLHNHDDGTWSCKTSMHVSSVGVSFEVRSDFTHKDPYSAVKQTLERMIETLSKYGVKV